MCTAMRTRLRLWFRTTLAAGLVGPAVLLTTAPPAAASSATLYVAGGGDNTLNSCSQAASPCATITYALSQAAPNATINVSGTIFDNVSVNGGGVTITGVNAASPAVIDGSSLASVFATTVELNLDHLTIRNGRTTDNLGGGGVQVGSAGTVRISDAVITGNVSAQGGGGIASLGSLTVTNTTVSGNTSQAGNGGGGVHAYAGATQITTSTFSGNTAPNAGGLMVGGNSTVTASVTVTGSTISGNSVASGGVGGGMRVYPNSSLIVSNSTVAGNTSSNGGGGLSAMPDSTATIVGSTIANNASTFGGGVSNSFGTVTLAGSILASNAGGNCSGDAGLVNGISGYYSLLNDPFCVGGGGAGV
ncbi:MAG: hypothetical protein ABIS47_12925, partial [Acidimicrobiales bacterium]